MPPQKRGVSRLDSETLLYGNIQSCHVTVSVADSKNEDDGTGPEIFLHFRRLDGTKFTIRLSGMTEREIKAFGAAVVESVKIALPLVRQRDKEAKEAEEHGETIRFRSHRGDPTITRIEGTKLRTYLKGLHD